ncbi:hypothetical protein [Mycobacterium shinjukuense]|nr:hypothetical protein [Mycobacterium shinjukuense]
MSPVTNRAKAPVAARPEPVATILGAGDGSCPATEAANAIAAR